MNLSSIVSARLQSNVLGIKREQSEGVLNPGRALLEPVVDTEGHIRQLAKALLERKGIVPEKAPEHLRKCQIACPQPRRRRTSQRFLSLGFESLKGQTP